MANSAITLSTYLGNQFDRNTISYFFKLTLGSGSYQLGGIPLNFAGNVQAPNVSALSYPIDVSFKSISTPPSAYTYKFSPLGQVVANITNIAESSGSVVTATAHNLFTVGQVVLIAGVTTATWLNGQYATVLSSGLSGTAFEFDDSTLNGTYASAADTGTATVQFGSALLGWSSLPGPNSGAFQIFTGTSEQSAGSTPAAAIADEIICTVRCLRG